MKTKTEETINCGWCGEPFLKRRPNMVYCKKECCNAATNQKLIEKYHSNKLKKNNKDRKCIDCSSNLSRYNQDDLCHACQIKKVESEKIDLLRSLGFAYIDEDNPDE